MVYEVLPDTITFLQMVFCAICRLVGEYWELLVIVIGSFPMLRKLTSYIYLLFFCKMPDEMDTLVKLCYIFPRSSL